MNTRSTLNLIFDFMAIQKNVRQNRYLCPNFVRINNLNFKC